MEKHNTRAHALLSASTAERWLNCTPSARLEESFGVKKTSKFAEEGTTAHELAEISLRHDLNLIDDNEYFDRLVKIMESEYYNEEMPDEVQKYVDYCLEQFEQAKTITADAIAEVEVKIDLTAYIPEGFGTDDFIIVADEVMEVIDLKYGKGVAVSAVENKQLMLYGLGALHRYAMAYNIKTVRLTIVQPRIDNFSSWDIAADDLVAWADELVETAKIAFEGKGLITPGSWCKFCSVKNTCPKLAETNLDLAKYDFAVPAMLSDDDIANILSKVHMLVEWANGIKAYALTEAVTNKKVWPGYKVVAGVARRKWIDEVTVANAILGRFPSVEGDDIYNQKLKPITELEKKFGKKVFAEKLSDVVIKPQGKLTLVPETDKRPAAAVDQAAIDFADPEDED